MTHYFEIKDDPTLKTSQILQMMREKFPVWSYYSDEQLDKDFPPPKEATTRYFKKTVEPDEETLGLSVQECEEKGLTDGITLRERLLMELQYFDETGEHLDVVGVTFCSGSHDSGGSVPYVYLSTHGWVYVHLDNLGRSYSRCGVRRAVKPENPTKSAPTDIYENLRNILRWKYSDVDVQPIIDEVDRILKKEKDT